MTKPAFFFLPLALLIFTSGLFAQDALEEARKKLSERNQTGGGGLGVSPQKDPERVLIYITYLSKERTWKSGDGRSFTGRLVAYSAPKPGEEGPIVAIKDGKVRLRPTNKPITEVPLANLSEEDQIFIKAINAGITPSITFLTKAREWKSTDGRAMTGRLVAFSAPRKGEEGEIVVIKDKKVRIMRTTPSELNFDIALDKLSPEDQAFVDALNTGIQSR